PSARALTPDVENRLRSLGYIASAAPARDAPSAANPETKIADWNAFEDALSALNAHRKEALGAFEALARRNPDSMVMQTSYSRALKEAGRIDRALAVSRAAAQRWAADASVLHDLAVLAREAAAGAGGAAAAALRGEAGRAEQAAIALAPDTAI